jgi:hypothetical protein
MVQPWNLEIQNSESQIAKMLAGAKGSFLKRNSEILLIANRLKLAGDNN